MPKHVVWTEKEPHPNPPPRVSLGRRFIVERGWREVWMTDPASMTDADLIEAHTEAGDSEGAPLYQAEIGARGLAG